MPHCCNVPKCSSREPGHRFPKDPALRKQWIIAIRRDQFIPTPHSRVCKKHFSSDDYELPKDSVKQTPTPRLKKTAVPSRFAWTDWETPAVEGRREEGRENSDGREVNLKKEIIILRDNGNAHNYTDLSDSDPLCLDGFENGEVCADTSLQRTEMEVQCDPVAIECEVEIECGVKDVGTECLICPCSLKPTLCDVGIQTDSLESSHDLRV